MYKVFFNGSTILIGPEMKKSLNDNISEKYESCNKCIVDQVINKIETSRNPLVFSISGDDCFQTWNQFRSCFIELPAAGGLVKNTAGSLLFIKRLSVWDLPKGKIEKDETPELAAVREVEEECGISGLNLVRQLDSTFHIYRSPFLPAEKNLVLKETKWFLMEYRGNQTPVPQTEEDIEAIRWFSPDDLTEVYSNTYLSLNDFLRKTLPVI